MNWSYPGTLVSGRATTELMTGVRGSDEQRRRALRPEPRKRAGIDRESGQDRCQLGRVHQQVTLERLGEDAPEVSG
jgi:hypothetical protein